MNPRICAAATAASCGAQAALAAGPIPFRPEESFWAPLWPALAVLGALVLVAAAAAYGARRFGWRRIAGAGRRLRILERLPVSRQGALLLVECDGRTLLIGQSGSSIRLVDRMESAPPAAPHER